MSFNRCKLLEAHDKRDLIEISNLIDLTDKPIGLTRDDIGWSRVRSNASNCICCCCNNSITLVTTEDSYVLDHVPLDNIQFAQTNSSLQYLALSNHRKIAIIDLVDNDVNCSCYGSSKIASETKVVNLTAHELTMGDIILWRWLDDTNLAILSYNALYTCSVNQQHINHPAYTAFSSRSRYLSMKKVFDIHQNLSALCQVYDIQRDSSGNFYAISSLYSTNSLLKLNLVNTQPNSPLNVSNNPSSVPTTLRPSFGSMPNRLSQLVNNDTSSESLKSDYLFDARQNQVLSQSSNEDEICGLVQVYCKIRDRSQLIQAHAITFTNSLAPIQSSSSNELSTSKLQKSAIGSYEKGPTTLVAANKIGVQMRVHFVEMATFDNTQTSGQSACPTTKFERSTGIDFPTSIVCSHVESSDGSHLHVAFITTKHGQVFVCSVTHSTILFNTMITDDIISSTILESNTQGLMVICKNGQVLLVRLNLMKLMRLLDESKTLRHIKSFNYLNTIDIANNNSIVSENHQTIATRPLGAGNQLSNSLDVGLEVLMSTKL